MQKINKRAYSGTETRHLNLCEVAYFFCFFCIKLRASVQDFSLNAVIYTTEVLNNLPTNGNFPAV